MLSTAIILFSQAFPVSKDVNESFPTHTKRRPHTLQFAGSRNFTWATVLSQPMSDTTRPYLLYIEGM